MNIFLFAAILQAVPARGRGRGRGRGRQQRRRAAKHADRVAARHAAGVKRAQSMPSDNVAHLPPCCNSDGVCDHPVGAGQAPQPAPPPGRPASPPPKRPEQGKDFPNLDEYYF